MSSQTDGLSRFRAVGPATRHRHSVWMASRAPLAPLASATYEIVVWSAPIGCTVALFSYAAHCLR
eukprot:12867711-Alexandrium_andersonii.AAC.1